MMASQLVQAKIGLPCGGDASKGIARKTVVIERQKLVQSKQRASGERNMELPTGLSLEQQFNLRAYEEEVKRMDSEQAQQLLLQVLRQLMVKENVIKHLLKQSPIF